LNHSKFSSIGSKSWEVDEGGKDGSTILLSYFPTSTSSQGGTQIGTEKEGGKGTKGIVGSSSQIWGVS